MMLGGDLKDVTSKMNHRSVLSKPFLYELKVVRTKRSGYGPPRKFQSSKDVYEAFRKRAERADREEFLALLLDTKNVMLGFHVVSVGTLAAVIVHPREVFKPAILANAASILLIHNHPSGDPDPSEEDIAVTKRIKKAGELLDIPVLDHVIIGDGAYFSFADKKML